MHVLLDVIQAAAVFAGAAAAFPAAEGLEARPHTGGGARSPIGVDHTGLDILQEPHHLIRVFAEEAAGQAIGAVVGLRIATSNNGTPATATRGKNISTFHSSWSNGRSAMIVGATK